MNRIDENFQELALELKRKSKEEIFNHIKECYFKLPNELRISIEKYLNTYNYWGKLEEQRGEYESLYYRATSLKEHIEDYIWLYQKLTDYRSKNLLYAILNNWYNFDMEKTKDVLEINYDKYWDLDIINPSKEEVIVDLGAYIGDSILSYFTNYGMNNYKKIYAYEITPESIEKLKNNTRYYKNIEIRKKAVLDMPKKVFMKKSLEEQSANTISDIGEEILEGVSLDLDIPDNISLLKMDIEGKESQALIGCQNHIRRETPKLLISVYHNYDDLWKIPRIVDEINPNYQYYLRYFGSTIFPTEIILYAIKKNNI